MGQENHVPKLNESENSSLDSFEPGNTMMEMVETAGFLYIVVVADMSHSRQRLPLVDTQDTHSVVAVVVHHSRTAVE